MARRKRVLLCLCVLIIAAIGFFVWGSRGRADANVLTIALVSYTNRVISPTNVPPGYLTQPTNLPFIIVLISNSGPVALYFEGGWARYLENNGDLYRDESRLHDFVPLSYSSALINPGSSLSLEMYMPPRCSAWSIQAHFLRWGPFDRFRDWIGRATPAPLQKPVSRVLPGLKTLFAEFGPFVNETLRTTATNSNPPEAVSTPRKVE